MSEARDNKKNPNINIAIQAIVYSIAASVIYDIALKPGTSKVIEGATFLFGSLSKTFIDFSYKHAATNPTASVLIFILFASTFVAVLSILGRITSTLTSGSDVDYDFLRSRTVILKIFSVASSLCFIFMLMFTLIMFTNSIAIWMIFNNNIAAIEAFSDQKEISNIKSQFSLIENKDDFTKIRIKIDEIANKNNIKIRRGNPW